MMVRDWIRRKGIEVGVAVAFKTADALCAVGLDGASAAALDVGYDLARRVPKEEPFCSHERMAAWWAARGNVLKEERDALGKAIGDAAIKAGICRSDVSLTGPQLLQLASDMVEDRERLAADLAEANDLRHAALEVCTDLRRELGASKAELAMWRLLYLDKPEDRLFHAADGTWWRRDDSRGVGTLVATDTPPIVQAWEAAYRTRDAYAKRSGNKEWIAYEAALHALHAAGGPDLRAEQEAEIAGSTGTRPA